MSCGAARVDVLRHLQMTVRYLRISAMKAWQIFAVGVLVLVAALLLPSYEPILAALAAIVMGAVVVVGFLFRPRRDLFYLRTTLVVSEPDYPLAVEHDRIAVRVELAGGANKHRKARRARRWAN